MDTVIRTYGHASIYVRTPGASMLIDPWFSEGGAFLGSWHQFPRNDHIGLSELRGVDYVLLSHEHRDHFDVDFLRSLSARTTLIIPQYTDDYLRRELHDHVPNKLVVLPSHQPVSLADDLRVTPVVQSVPIWDDCTFIVETPHGVLADVNDMKVSARDLDWVRRTFTVDYLFMQYSGANWHPHIYGYDPERKREVSRRKRYNKLASVYKTFLSSGARWLVPMAGPPCFLDPTQFELNFEEDSIFPDLADFYRYAQQQGFDDRTIILMPGDSLEPAGNHAAANLQRLRAPCFTDKRNYLEVYQRDRQAEIEKQLDAVPIPDGPLLSAAQEYFQPLIASSAYFRRKIDGRLLLEITGRYPQDVIVDFTRANDSVYPHNDEDYFYVLRIEDRLLNLVLRHELSWEELLLSMRLTARRNPDQYNEFLVVFLRFANPESYRAYARYERRRKLDERTVVFENGVPYEIQRYCPHAMADLGQGEVIDGCVVCPGHGWAFRLNDGRCTTNPAVIAVRRLDAEM